MNNELSEAIKFRRSVRLFQPIDIDYKIVKKCLEYATLAPNSSNLQLWEFYHITSKKVLEQLTKACFNQDAARTANQMVVIVVRKDLWKERASANIKFLTATFKKSELDKSTEKRKKMAFKYYKKIIPSIYNDFFGLIGILRYATMQFIGLFKSVYRQVRWSDMRIVAHKSAGLAAQTFMLKMAATGYDTCPMEGSDTLRVKRILNLPHKAEINMIIACGIRQKSGVYGPRFRIPFKAVYKEI